MQGRNNNNINNINSINNLLLTPTPTSDFPKPKGSTNRKNFISLQDSANKLRLTPISQLDLTATPNTPKSFNVSSDQIGTPLPQYSLLEDEKYSAQNFATFPPIVSQLLKTNFPQNNADIKGKIEGENVCIYNNERIFLWKNSLLTKKIPKCFNIQIENGNERFPFIHFIGKNGMISVTTSGAISLWFNPFISTPPLTDRIPLSSNSFVSSIHVFLVNFFFRFFL